MNLICIEPKGNLELNNINDTNNEFKLEKQEVTRDEGWLMINTTELIDIFDPQLFFNERPFMKQEGIYEEIDETKKIEKGFGILDFSNPLKLERINHKLKNLLDDNKYIQHGRSKYHYSYYKGTSFLIL